MSDVPEIFISGPAANRGTWVPPSKRDPLEWVESKGAWMTWPGVPLSPMMMILVVARSTEFRSLPISVSSAWSAAW